MPDTAARTYGLRPGAEEFPLMIVISIIYPCNYGCPNCPYTDGNSEIRQFYHQRNGDLFPVPLWNKIACEAGPYGAWLRCTGGGEPMLHPQMVSMIEYAKAQGARIWMNTNGSMFGPLPSYRAKLERLLKAGIDLSEALGAAQTLYPEFNPLLSLKALAYYGEPTLAAVPPGIRETLIDESAKVQSVPPVKKLAASLTISR